MTHEEVYSTIILRCLGNTNKNQKEYLFQTNCVYKVISEKYSNKLMLVVNILHLFTTLGATTESKR